MSACGMLEQIAPEGYNERRVACQSEPAPPRINHKYHGITTVRQAMLTWAASLRREGQSHR